MRKKLLLLFFLSNINALFKQISRKLGRPNKLQRTYYFQYMHFSKPCGRPRKIVGQHLSIRLFKIPNNVLCTLNNVRLSYITQISTCTLTFQPRLNIIFILIYNFIYIRVTDIHKTQLPPVVKEKEEAISTKNNNVDH